MNAYRTKPDFRKTPLLKSPPKEDDPMSCIWIPLFIGISYFVLKAISRVTSNQGSELDQVICYGALFFFTVIMLLGARDTHQENKAEKEGRKKWAGNCKIALLVIMSRHEANVWWDDSTNRPHSSPNMLELEISADLKEVFSSYTMIQVTVDQHVFDRLKACNTVRIYYMPESPTTFLLEEEL